jgi:hypothetical protein
MAITKDPGRQTPLVATYTFVGGTDITTVDQHEVIDLPAGAIITGGSFYTPAGFTGDGTIAIHLDALVLVAAADIDAEMNQVFDMVTVDALGEALTAANTIDVVVAVAVLSAGTGRIIVEYVIEDRATEVNP